MHMYNVIILVNEWMRESARADVIFVASWPSEPMEVLTNITWDGPSPGAGEWEIPNSPRKKALFYRVCMNVLHHVDNNALCSMRVLKFGRT